MLAGIAGQLEAPGSGYFVGRFDYSYQYKLNQQLVSDPRISGALAGVIDCLAQESSAAGGSGKDILVTYSVGGTPRACWTTCGGGTRMRECPLR